MEQKQLPGIDVIIMSSMGPEHDIMFVDTAGHGTIATTWHSCYMSSMGLEHDIMFVHAAEHGTIATTWH